MHLGHGEPQEQHSASREGQDLQRLGLPALPYLLSCEIVRGWHRAMSPSSLPAGYSVPSDEKLNDLEYLQHFGGHIEVLLQRAIRRYL